MERILPEVRPEVRGAVVSPIVAGLLAIVVLQSLLLGAVLRLYRREKRANKQRRVEAPNSVHKSPYVMDMEARERWESLDLARLHEVNREEIETLLAKVGATGVKSLSGGERAFLDRMAEAHDRVAGRARNGAHAAPSRQVPRHS
jgi:hypothetical protein